MALPSQCCGKVRIFRSLIAMDMCGPHKMAEIAMATSGFAFPAISNGASGTFV